MLIHIKKVHEKAVTPSYAYETDAGFDLVAVEEVSLFPGMTKAVSTGLCFEIPAGWQLEIRPRSGLSLNTPLRVANAPGTVDAGYTGEVKVVMTNSSDHKYETIKAGTRIAQGVLTRVQQAVFVEVPQLVETKRGSNGFGSTGT